MGVWGWCWWRERRNQGCLFGLGLQQLVSCGIFFVPIETEMLVEEQFWVGSAVSPYVPHGVLRWRCLWDLQVRVCSWQLEVHFFVSPVLKDKHFNNCLRLDYTFYNASLEGLGLLKDLSMPWIHPNFCISPPPGSLISYLLNTYTTTWLLRPSCLAPEWTSLRDLPGCQTALRRDCATSQWWRHVSFSTFSPTWGNIICLFYRWWHISVSIAKISF